MTFLDFFVKYNGKLVDVDSYPKRQPFQCVDLARLYVREVYGLPVGTLCPGDAKEIYLKAPNIAGGQYFQKITNLPWNAPQQGDIVFWKEPFGPYVDDKGVKRYAGHVAIVNTANTRRFTSFEQNYGSNIGSRLVEHDYRGVLGWLRFKGKTT